MTHFFGQIILIIALIFFVFYVFRVRSVLTDRIAYIACAVIGIILVIMPDFTSKIANLLGIGRGTDLLFYLFIIVALFYAAEVSSEVKRLKRQVTDLTRELALHNPTKGENKD
jgi:small membrane protein